MPCFSPLVAWRMKNPDGKSRVFFSLPPGVHVSNAFEQIKLPCGRCIGCRLERSRQWAMRCVMEAKNHSENCFITLTYDDNHLPPDQSLLPADLQKFFKRLRKFLGDKKIRYFACGEYGERGNRPHYHAIIFGHNFEDRIRTINPLSQTPVGYSPALSKLWTFGYSSVGDMTFESAAYVARYCVKKYYGKPADVAAHYGKRKPEFVVMSRKPGIASEWFDKFGLTDVYPADNCLSRGKLCKPPRYFDKLLEKIDSELLKYVKEKRELKAKEIPSEELLRKSEYVKKKTELKKSRKL